MVPRINVAESGFSALLTHLRCIKATLCFQPLSLVLIMTATTPLPSYDVLVLQTVERVSIGTIYAILIGLGLVINVSVLLFGYRYANHYIREPFYILLIQFIPAGVLVLGAHLCVGVFTTLWTGSTVSLAAFQASTLAKSASTAEAVGTEALVLLAAVICFNRWCMNIRTMRHLFKGDRVVIWVAIVWVAVLAHVVASNLHQCFKQFNSTFFYFTYACKEQNGTGRMLIILGHVIFIFGPILGILFGVVAFAQVKKTLRTREPTTSSISTTIIIPLPRRMTKLRRNLNLLQISVVIAVSMLPMVLTNEIFPFISPIFNNIFAVFENVTVLVAAMIAPVVIIAFDPLLRTELIRFFRILRCKKT